MPDRKKIGIYYFYDENWIGGIYYIQNLVLALDTLEDAQKPFIVLYSNPAQFEPFKKITGYPYLMHSAEYEPPFTLPEQLVNWGRKFLKKPLPDKRQFVLDFVFPVFDTGDEPNGKPVNVHWIPDFQEHYLPEFFSKEEVERRIAIQKTVSTRSGALLLLSSQAALDDYKKIHPEARTKNYVVSFAVSHPPYQDRDIDAIRQQYSIPEKYYISSNQFWAHKNHRVVIEAVRILKDEGVKACVVFTGKPNDWRNPAYYDELQALVEQHDLTDRILFLGLIDRPDQLQLMKHAEAVIQPSRFEGWSTVIEDAKAMDQLVIASALPVHREQLKENGYFFDPLNAAELAGLMRSISQDRPGITPNNYREKVKGFAADFLAMLKNN